MATVPNHFELGLGHVTVTCPLLSRASVCCCALVVTNVHYNHSRMTSDYVWPAAIIVYKITRQILIYFIFRFGVFFVFFVVFFFFTFKSAFIVSVRDKF